MDYPKVIRALEKDGWHVIRQKGSHIRLEKWENEELLKLTIPAHSPIKRSTLSYILKDAKIELKRFLQLLKK